MAGNNFAALLRGGRNTLVLALLLVFTLSAADARDTLHRSNPSEPDTLDPQRAILDPDRAIIAELFHGLVNFNAKGEIFADAAKSWDVSRDGLTWTFRLRDGLVWSDGTPVTAYDYKAGIHRLYAPETASPSAGYLYMIKNARGVNSGKLPSSALGVNSLDNKTLEITLARPAPLFILELASGWFLPIPRHVVERVGDKWIKPGNFVGNGPFLLSEWSPNDRIVLRKNPLFADAASVKLEKVIFYPTEDTDASLKRFRAGELDLVAGTPSHKIDFLRKHLPDQTRTTSISGVNYVAFNTQVAPFDDIRVRRALSLAIDREIFANKVLKKGEAPAYRFVPPAIGRYTSASLAFSTQTIELRRQRSRELLKAAGYDSANPLTFEFRVRASPDRKRGAVVLQAMWRAIGVRAEILSTDLKVHYADLELGSFQAAGSGFSSYTPDAFLESFLSDNYSGNYSRYANPDYDRVLRAAFLIADVTERHRQMAIAEQLMLKDHPIAPINYSVTGNLVATHLRGFEDNVYNTHQSRYMWIDDDARAD